MIICFRGGLWVAGALLFWGPAAVAQEAEQAPAAVDGEADLSSLSLEELAMVRVTSVSRRPEPLAAAAAAIFVISQEDIRRSGATSLPEVLRLAPNLNVQRVNAADYAVSARGFNGFETSNKLLVLVDGMSVYSTLQSGVFWDGRTLGLEDIERIEVISGPGGALYGANAVNGVISIITRHARDTQGGLVAAGAGTEDNVFSLRYGGRLGERLFWRAYVSAFERDDSLRETRGEATDSTAGLRGGLRADWSGVRDEVALQAELFDNRVRNNEDFTGVRGAVEGGHLNAVWRRNLDDGGALQVQAYYDRFSVSEPGLSELSETTDLSAQHALDLGERHQLVWGGAYRQVKTALHSEFGGGLDPAERRLRLASVFAQDQIALTGNLNLTVGAKFEDNSFTGQEFLPNVRLAWRRDGGALAWLAASRASRTPSRIERDLSAPGVIEPADFQSERLTAYEAGYRSRPLPNASLSVSAFYNVYDDLRTVAPDPVTILPFRFANGGRGTTYGLEAWGSWDVRPDWRLSGGVSTLEKDFEVKPGQLDAAALASVGADPARQLILRSQSDLTDQVELDVRLRAVDDLEPSVVQGYVEADVRIGWRVTDSLELSITGQNLINERRVETADPQRRRAFGRSVHAALRMGF